MRSGPSVKSFTEYLTFDIPERMAFLNITPQLEQIVERSGIKDNTVQRSITTVSTKVFFKDVARRCSGRFFLNFDIFRLITRGLSLKQARCRPGFLSRWLLVGVRTTIVRALGAQLDWA